MLQKPDLNFAAVGRQVWGAVRHPQQYWRASFITDLFLSIGFVLYTCIYVQLFYVFHPTVWLFGRTPGWRARGSSSSTPSSHSPKRQLRRSSESRASRPSGPWRPRRALSFSCEVIPQPRSAFLSKLPVEIRQEIYRYVIVGRNKHFVRLGFADTEHEKDFQLADSPYRTYDTSSSSTFPPPPSFNRKISANFNGDNTRAGPPPHWPTTSNLLALPLTSRQTYVEVIDILHKMPTFKVSRLFTLHDLQLSFLPQRFAAIRRLELAYEFRCGLPLVRETAIREDADWDRFWDIVAWDMPGLRQLRVDLFNFDIRALVVAGRESHANEADGGELGMEAELEDGEPASEGRLVRPEDDEQKWEWLRHMLRVKGLDGCRVKLHHARKLNLVHSILPPVSKYMEHVIEMLEHMIGASMVEGGPSDRETGDVDVPDQSIEEVFDRLVRQEI